MDAEVEVIEVDIVEVEFVDLEECARHGSKPHRAKSYRIVVDRTPHTVHRHEMTGAEILALAGKPHSDWSLTEKLPGGRRERIRPDQIVVFHHHAIERFETSPNKVRNGEAPLAGPLSDEDRAFLDGLEYPWNLVQDAGAWAVVLNGYRLPDAFTPQVADMMIRVPVHYPISGLDMFNFRPSVSRQDGKPLGFLSNFVFRGEQWQQWSRHRLPQTPWNPAFDSMATHFRIIEDALARDAA